MIRHRYRPDRALAWAIILTILGAVTLGPWGAGAGALAGLLTGIEPRPT